jgi:glycosyltransferase involved in cell wall biosynthesis
MGDFSSNTPAQHLDGTIEFPILFSTDRPRIALAEPFAVRTADENDMHPASRPLRVLVISHTSVSRDAGQARCIPLLDHADIQCRLLVPTRWKNNGIWQTPESSANPQLDVQVGKVVWPWTGPGQWYLHWYRDMARIFRDFSPDVVHLWEEPWGLVTAQAAWLRNRWLPGTRLIVETEQNIYKNLPVPFEWFRSVTLRNADFLVARSNEATAVARAKGYAGPAAVVGYGIDPHLFKPTDRDQARRALGFSGFVVGYAGRLTGEKGLSDLIDALARLPSHVNLVFVGAGPLRQSLAQQAEALSVGARIRFMSSRSPAELSQVMSGLDAFALVSRTTPRWKEQFGRVIIEAQACGVPVIGSDSGAIPRVVGPGGIIVRERRPDDIASAVLRLEGNPNLRNELGRAGRAQVAEKYTWQHVSNRLLQIYRSVRRRIAADHATASRLSANEREHLGLVRVMDSPGAEASDD